MSMHTPVKVSQLMGIAVLLITATAGCAGGTDQAPSPTPDTNTSELIADRIVSTEFDASTADFPNPERGFYRPDFSGDLATLTADTVAETYDNGHRLIYARIKLDPYRNADIPAPYLDALQAGFETARRGGVKLIVRAAYNYPRGETEYHDAQDAPLSRVLSHLEQLKPILHENVDVIANVQAGFIGAWGEWHASSNDLTTPENRTKIKDALFDAVPAERFVQFRYPPYIMEWQPTLPDLKSALDGNFRTAFHNDCFLASETDVGTYDEDPDQRAREQQYMDDLGDLTVYGGETCRPADAPGAKPRTTCADILAEGARYNLTYLNDSYYRGLFHENWIEDGCMEDVRRSMGYRLTLLNASHSAVATQGAAFELSFTLHNSGWARLYNPRAIEVVMRNTGSGVTRRFEAQGSDPRAWLPGADAEETITVTLPEDMQTGPWDVWIALPDADTPLKHDPRYAIRFANADNALNGQIWDETIGAFALGTAVDIRSGPAS